MKNFKFLTVFVMIWAVSWSYGSGGYDPYIEQAVKKEEIEVQLTEIVIKAKTQLAKVMRMGNVEQVELQKEKIVEQVKFEVEQFMEQVKSVLTEESDFLEIMEQAEASLEEISKQAENQYLVQAVNRSPSPTVENGFQKSSAQKTSTDLEEVACFAGVYAGTLDVYWGTFNSITNSNSTPVQAEVVFTSNNDADMLVAIEWNEEDDETHLLCSWLDQVMLTDNKLTGGTAKHKGSIIDVGRVFPEFEFENCEITSIQVGGTREYEDDSFEVIEDLEKTSKSPSSWQELNTKCKNHNRIGF